MDKIIKVEVYGIGEELLGSCCSNKKESHSNCSGGCSGSCQTSKSCLQAFEDLKKFLEDSDIKDNVSIKFIEMDSKALREHEEIRELIKRGFDLPVIIIDGIVRYYGGISTKLVCKDVEELLEYYSKNK